MKNTSFTTQEKKKVNVPSLILDAYGLTILIYFVVRTIGGDRWSAIALLTNCISIALFTAFFLLPIAVRKQNLRMSLWSSVLVTAFLLEFGHRFLPKDGVLESGMRQVVILSHNVGQDLPNYSNLNKLVHDSKADVVLLQEVTQEYINTYWKELNELYP